MPIDVRVFLYLATIMTFSVCTSISKFFWSRVEMMGILHSDNVSILPNV